MASNGSGSAARWNGVKRVYSSQDVERLRGSIKIEHTLARLGAERLWELLHTDPYVPALGAMTGGQAVEMVQAGLKAIYLSGWQVAADANSSMQTYPDQSLYPVDSVPRVVSRINNAFQRMDQMQHSEGRSDIHWFAPIVADAEAGFGGNLNAYELMKALIEAGAAGVHFEVGLPSGYRAAYPGKLLAYNCSPSFNWKKKLSDGDIARFQATLGGWGFKFQFITLAGFHALNYSMFTLARDYATRGMSAYAELQEAEFGAEKSGYRATTHQKFVGTGYFDLVSQVISEGTSSVTALKGSTEEEQFAH
ncbi:Isocitrate lyase [Tetrabaena socialis]|uniref:Isocitrate lyase n=1 Tax=Tetrabaena socialis TaxID=47790 RepID=A0A2J7ZWB3_9CHLO|nr:Isocitrate lyase [Tetrabaena socialis]|eukprot:PNH04546.1 Isocitrate lyase [Tetrabaena socialis]